jgi:hypothetical protein
MAISAALADAAVVASQTRTVRPRLRAWRVMSAPEKVFNYV